MPNPNLPTKDYPQLRRLVQETLLLGQQKIEEAKVQTYWQTGKHINDHLLRHQLRADHYGEGVVARLAEDLGISRDVLWRCVKFAQSFKKIVVSRPQSLSWSHYRRLITVADEDLRMDFMNRAISSGWTSDELGEKIQQEIKSNPKQISLTPPLVKPHKLIPRQGIPYTYRVIEMSPVHKKSEFQGVRVDLGFQCRSWLPPQAAHFEPKTIIESVKKDDGYTLSASKREESDLYTYYSSVERVVDGDTLVVEIDLGFSQGIRQYLRLRGIDAPELSTPEGKRAKAFVERELRQVEYILLCSSRSDKYDRYLADVYYGEGEEQKYLNQILLDEGLAVRME